MLVLLDDDAVTTNQIDDTSKSRLSHPQLSLTYHMVLPLPSGLCCRRRLSVCMCVCANRITHKLKSL